MENKQNTLIAMCWFMEIGLIISMILLPFLSLMLISPDIFPKTLAELIISEAENSEIFVSPGHFQYIKMIYVFHDVVIMAVLAHIYLFFKSVRKGDIFSQKQIDRIFRIGVGITTLIFLEEIENYMTWVMSNMHYSYMDSIINRVFNRIVQLAMGTGIIITSYILRMAKEMKDEQDLVV
ncbi:MULTISPECIES: DUF2975 domain-containing protein [Enterobacterales]|uniref:DUF2975 domain-containing protein n=1 Tax=Enterobacterales TaxID=91347 RepID=UPI002EDA55D4